MERVKYDNANFPIPKEYINSNNFVIEDFIGPIGKNMEKHLFEKKKLKINILIFNHLKAINLKYMK